MFTLLHRLAVRNSLPFHIFYKFNCTDPGLQLTLHSLVCCCGFADILNILENHTLSSGTSPDRPCQGVPPPVPERKGTFNGWSIPIESITGGKKIHAAPHPHTTKYRIIEIHQLILSQIYLFFPQYNLNTSFVRITRHFRYRQLLKHVAFHDRKARRGLRLRDETMASRCCGSKNKALKNISIHFCYLL